MQNANERLWVRVSQRGYVTVSRVPGYSKPVSEYRLPGPNIEPRPDPAVLTRAEYDSRSVGSPERAEGLVPMPVAWIATVPIEQAVHEMGIFADQNSVCASKTPGRIRTVRRLEDYINFSEARTAFPAAHGLRWTADLRCSRTSQACYIHMYAHLTS